MGQVWVGAGRKWFPLYFQFRNKSTWTWTLNNNRLTRTSFSGSGQLTFNFTFDRQFETNRNNNRSNRLTRLNCLNISGCVQVKPKTSLKKRLITCYWLLLRLILIASHFHTQNQCMRAVSSLSTHISKNPMVQCCCFHTNIWVYILNIWQQQKLLFNFQRAINFCYEFIYLFKF